MTDDMSDCDVGEGQGCAALPEQVGADRNAIGQLPTMQRNALRKIFDRAEYSPVEVAALGYRRLQQAEGVGSKGLATIIAWLLAHGIELKPVEHYPDAPKVRRASPRRIEQAVRLLRTHGYVVQDENETGQGAGRR